MSFSESKGFNLLIFFCAFVFSCKSKISQYEEIQRLKSSYSDTTFMTYEANEFPTIYLGYAGIIKRTMLMGPLISGTDSVSAVSVYKKITSYNYSEVQRNIMINKNKWFLFHIENMSNDSIWFLQLPSENIKAHLFRKAEAEVDSIIEIPMMPNAKFTDNLPMEINFKVIVSKSKKSTWLLNLVYERPPFTSTLTFLPYDSSEKKNSNPYFTYGLISGVLFFICLALFVFFIQTQDIIYGIYLIYFIISSLSIISDASDSFPFEKYQTTYQIVEIVLRGLRAYILILVIGSHKDSEVYSTLIKLTSYALVCDIITMLHIANLLSIAFVLWLLSCLHYVLYSIQIQKMKEKKIIQYILPILLFLSPLAMNIVASVFKVSFRYYYLFLLDTAALFLLTRRFVLHKKQLKKEGIIDAVLRERRLSEKVIDVLEEERKRFAEDLHDDLGGHLAALRIKVQLLSEHPNALNPILKIVDDASRSVRNISHNLMPTQFKETELKVSLDDYFHEINLEKKIRFNFTYSGVNNPFSKDNQLMIYRIVMELTNNCLKHSKASSADIQMLFNHETLRIIFEDNGAGFSSESGDGIGLRNMKSRVSYLNGSFSVDSNSEGTTIIIILPFH